MMKKFSLEVEVQEANNDDPIKGYIVESKHRLHVSICGGEKEGSDRFSFSFYLDEHKEFPDLYIKLVWLFEKIVTSHIKEEVERLKRRDADGGFSRGPEDIVDKMEDAISNIKGNE